MNKLSVVLVVAMLLASSAMPAAAQSRGAPMPAPQSDPAAPPTSGAPQGTTGRLGLRPVEHPPTITLPEAFALAASKSTDLRVAAAQVRAAEASITKAWAVLLPNISIGANYTFNAPEQTARFGSEEQLKQQALLFNSLGDLTAQSAALTPDPVQRQATLERAAELRAAADQLANQKVAEFIIQPAHVLDGNLTFAMPLFSGRALPLLQNAYGAVALTKLSTQQAKAAVLWGVAQAYLQAVATKNIVAIADEQVASARRHHALAEQRATQGMLTALAVERALLDVKKAEQQATQARGAQRMAKAALADLLGRVDDFDVETPAPLAGIDEAAGVDAMLARAWQQRLDLRVQKEAVAIAERTRTEAWTRLLPSVQLVAQGRYTTNTAGLITEPITGAVIVQASLPIFDGGMTIGTIREATARLDAEMLRVRQLEQTIDREIRGTLDDVALKQENVETSTAVADLAHKQSANAEELFAQGVATDNDVRDARLAHFAADVDAARARLDLQTSRLGLAYALGELASLVGVADVVPEDVAADEHDAARRTLARIPAQP
jgi:outer membrane protein TolC